MDEVKLKEIIENEFKNYIKDCIDMDETELENEAELFAVNIIETFKKSI